MLIIIFYEKFLEFVYFLKNFLRKVHFIQLQEIHFRFFVMKLMIGSLLLLLLEQNVCSYKILIYSPRIGSTNVEYLGRIADELIKAGHNAVS